MNTRLGKRSREPHVTVVGLTRHIYNIDQRETRRVGAGRVEHAPKRRGRQGIWSAKLVITNHMTEVLKTVR